MQHGRCEDDSPMRFIAQEVRAGVLAIIVFAATDEAKLNDTAVLVERGFRVGK